MAGGQQKWMSLCQVQGEAREQKRSTALKHKQWDYKASTKNDKKPVLPAMIKATMKIPLAKTHEATDKER